MPRGLRWASLGAALLCLTASAAMAAPTPQQLTAKNRKIMADFAHIFYDLRDVRRAFDLYVAHNYVQHNPDILDGKEAAIAALEPMFATPGSRFVVKKIMVDGDLAVIHLHGRSGPNGLGGSVADFYRLKNGKIVEHWDVLQPIRADTPNPHPYF